MTEPVMSLQGEWTIHHAAQLRVSLLESVEQGVCTYDLQAIQDMDSAGLQLLLAAQRSLHRQGRELCLVNPSASVRDVLRVFGLDVNLSAVDDVLMPAKEPA